MKLINTSLVSVVFVLFSSASYSIPIYPDKNHDDWMSAKNQMDLSSKKNNQVNNEGPQIFDDVINQIFSTIDEELDKIDFTKEDITKLKEFSYRGIMSKSMADLRKSDQLIVKNTETLIAKYKQQNNICNSEKEYFGEKNLGQMNQECFNSFVRGLCPLYPFC